MRVPHYITAFIRLGRPHFLFGGFVLHGLGAAIALFAGARLDMQALLWGQAAITATQWMTHYSNDYFDLAADRANSTPTRWSGGSRVLPDGVLPPWVALAAAIGLSVLALAATLMLALIVRPGAFSLALPLLALVLAWSYSAPPPRLHSRGLGELTTALLVPGMTPLIGFYLQTGRIDRLLLLAVAPLCCLQFAMLLLIEFPDATGDAAAGKNTLVVRLGGVRAARLYVFAVALAYASLPLLALAGLPVLVAAAAGLWALPAAWLGWKVARGAWAEPAYWNILAFGGVGLFMGTALAELLAFLALLPAIVW